MKRLCNNCSTMLIVCPRHGLCETCGDSHDCGCFAKSPSIRLPGRSVVLAHLNGHAGSVGLALAAVLLTGFLAFHIGWFVARSGDGLIKFALGGF